MIHYGTYRGAVVGLRGAAVGNIGIPTYVISRGAVVRQPIYYHLGNVNDTLHVKFTCQIFTLSDLKTILKVKLKILGFLATLFV